MSGASDQAKGLLCTAQDRIGAVTGDPAVKVVAHDGWARGKTLTVCAQMKVGIATGLVPLPQGGIITSKVDMAIEQMPVSALSFTSAEESPVPGGSWSWC